MSFGEIFIIFVMAIIILMYVRNFYGEIDYVRSKVDGRQYLVKKLPDRQQAADMLASINKDLMLIVQHVMAKFGEDDPRAKLLFKNYNPDAMSEGGHESGYTSFSVNKGEKLVMCIRQKDGTFVDKNVLMYVAIHELGHMMTSEVGHTPAFWDNFKFLLGESIKLGLYKKVDYARTPVQYCGMTISSSVL